ncbi:Protein kinase family protein [Melia azedarach]|uniref:Protein kinase family protein n=1 Tax=Melia azedarach TaxID=155640 RepID=A0ACC1Y2M5_MELAZ|nr:Protein kinase family protein [Melia azedarach]
MLPPILNAIEIYMLKRPLQLQTDQNDVDAIINIKSKYGVKRIWQGDPCGPKGYWWDGLNCSYGDGNAPRIVSLNLSSSGLTGEIAAYFANLTSIQYLDLSYNSLSGEVPDFLSKLPSLKVLNLRRNKLSGSLPDELMKRSKNGLLTLSVDENPNICLSTACKTKKDNFVIPIVASVAALSGILIGFAIFFGLKRRKKQVMKKVQAELENISDSFASKRKQFTYSDILTITNNFEKLAVKMLSSSSAQGYKEFVAEVRLLMRVHHRNLTTLVGYCIEGTNMGLIYEYMANGSLDQYLKGKNEYILSWEERMRIALDAAQGLEYLHNGCKPPIVHRDVKPSNIILNEKFQGKLADFGLSRIFSIESGTHISTVVAGTPGYLDPEYYLSNWLNEKSDVYSFGIVLLEIITGQPVISKDQENAHISQLVSSKLAEGDIGSIVDPNLAENFNNSSAWKAVDIALACASQNSSNRPTMSEVVIELKECLAIETAQNDKGIKSKGPRRMVTVNVDDEFSPRAR